MTKTGRGSKLEKGERRRRRRRRRRRTEQYRYGEELRNERFLNPSKHNRSSGEKFVQSKSVSLARGALSFFK